MIARQKNRRLPMEARLSIGASNGSADCASMELLRSDRATTKTSARESDGPHQTPPGALSLAWDSGLGASPQTKPPALQNRRDVLRSVPRGASPAGDTQACRTQNSASYMLPDRSPKDREACVGSLRRATDHYKTDTQPLALQKQDPGRNSEEAEESWHLREKSGTRDVSIGLLFNGDQPPARLTSSPPWGLTL